MPDKFIQSLVADFKPVGQLDNRQPWFAMAVLCCVAIAVVAATMGLRADLLAGLPADVVLLRGGVVLMLGVASLIAVVAYARPNVGRHSDGWIWALAAAALFPGIALLSAVEGRFPKDVLTAPSGLVCLGVSVSIAIFMAAALTLWVRRGATVRVSLQSWLIGLSAGSFATFCYSLHCTSTTVIYAGFWYTGAITMSAGIGRMVLPRVLKW